MGGVEIEMSCLDYSIPNEDGTFYWPAMCACSMLSGDLFFFFFPLNTVLTEPLKQISTMGSIFLIGK